MDCPVGKISAAAEATECTVCSKGTYAGSTALSVCADCARGKIAATDGLAACSECPVGSIAAEVGLTACTLCPAGSSAPSKGLSYCTDCEAPFYANAGSANCSICDVNYVLDTRKGAGDGRKLGDDDCLECPTHGTVCDKPGARLERLEIEAGYFRISEESHEQAEVRKCFMGQRACKGGTNFTDNGDSYCGRGYEGPYCDVCSDGHYKDSTTQTCTTCSDSAQSPALIIFLFVLAGILFLVICKMMAKGKLEKLLKKVVEHESGPEGAKNQNKSIGKGLENPSARATLTGGDAADLMESALESIQQSDFKTELHELFGKVIKPKLKIMTAFAQLVTTMGFNLNISFPNRYARFLNSFDFVNLSLFKVVPIDCVLDSNYYRQLLTTTLLPLFIGAIILILHWCNSRQLDSHVNEHGAHRIDDAEFLKHKRRYLTIFLLLSYLILTTCSSVILRTFKCDYFEDNDTWYMSADYSVVCGLGEDGSERTDARVGWLMYASIMVGIDESRV